MFVWVFQKRQLISDGEKGGGNGICFGDCVGAARGRQRRQLMFGDKFRLWAMVLGGDEDDGSN